MRVREVATGLKKAITILEAALDDLKLIKTNRNKTISDCYREYWPKKIYDGIAGCLIAFACRRSVTKYGPLACVSLVPKTGLIKHYMQKYYMQHAGWQLYLEGNVMNKLLKEYI